MEILKQDGATQSELRSQQNIVDDYTRKLNAYSTVLDGNVQQKATQAAAQLSDQLEQKSAYHINSAKQGLGELGQFGIDTLAAGTQLASALAANQIVPGGAVILNALNSMGAETKNARQHDASLEQQLAAGLGNTALSLGTEKLFNLSSPMKNAYGPGLLDSPLARALEEVRTSAVGRVGLSALTEGGEEFAEALAQPILQRIIYDPDAEIDLNDAFYQGFVGATVGGLTDTVDVVATTPAEVGFLSGFLGKDFKNLPQKADSSINKLIEEKSPNIIDVQSQKVDPSPIVSVQDVSTFEKQIEVNIKIDYHEDGTVIVTDDWKAQGKSTIPSNYRPNAIIETNTTYKNGNIQIDRSFYDADGWLVWQIHSGNHNKPHTHKFGVLGNEPFHKHLFYRTETGVKRDPIAYPITESEKRANKDIIMEVKNDRD